MTDEDAFLAALSENPTDDVRRLVYADWLEERGQTEKANYLRLACQVVEALGTPEEEAAIGRVVAVSSKLSPEWRQAAAGRFGLVLWNVPADRKIFAVKILRELFDLGLAEAKAESERLPNHLPLHTTAEAVQAVRERFSANIHTEIVTSDWARSSVKVTSPHLLTTFYDIHLDFYHVGEGDPSEALGTAMKDILAFVNRVSQSGAVVRNTRAPDAGFSATILQSVPLLEVSGLLAAIRPETKQLAKQHQLHSCLMSVPSRTPTETRP